MATAFVNGVGAKDDVDDASFSVQLSSVNAGALIVGLVKWEGLATTISTLSDGSSGIGSGVVLDPDGPIHDAGSDDLNGQMFYILSSVASGTVTYSVTLAAARPFKQIALAQFTYSGTASFQDSASAAGVGASMNSGNITVTGTDSVAVGFWGNYATGTPTDTRGLLGASVGVADSFGNSDGTQGWYRLMTSGATGACTHDNPPGNEWLAHAIGFGISAGGGGGAPNLPRVPVGAEVLRPFNIARGRR